MEEQKEILQNLKREFAKDLIKNAIKETSANLKKAEDEFLKNKQSITESITQLQRKNSQIESEIERLKLIQSKNSNLFSKKNNERIKLSRRIIELEQDNESMETKILKKEGSFESLEEEIRKSSFPSADELYYEIIKGFGIEFTDKKGEIVAKVKNQTKKDLVLIKCRRDNKKTACDAIWSNMK